MFSISLHWKMGAMDDLYFLESPLKMLLLSAFSDGKKGQINSIFLSRAVCVEFHILFDEL